MVKKINCLKTFIGCFLILLQVSVNWGADLSASVVQIYSGADYLCAGTLVKDIYVVTSAECLIWQKNAAALSVVGNVIRDKLTPDDKSVVTDIFKPEDYDSHTRHMDVAVLKLAKSIAGKVVKSTELCNLESVEHDEPLTLYAFHVLVNNNNYRKRASLLRSYKVNVIDKETCEKSYRKEFTDTTFCGADHQRIDCFEDRGGPASIRGQFCGVYRWGDICIENSYPAAFTSLAHPKVLEFLNEYIV